jgi:alpha-maltose-1-phosphate synthase
MNEKMKILLLYPYPLEPDGQSLQGHYLEKGLKELGIDVVSCSRDDSRNKKKIYKTFNPDFCIGIGFWGNIPESVHHPLKHKIKTIPWFNANGWVANYHETLNSLPLVLATSNWVKSTYMRDGVKGDNIEVLGIGFDPTSFHPYPENDLRIKKEREDLGIKENELMIFTAGGDVTSKGAQEMLQALAIINKTFKNWKYILKVNDSFSAHDHGKEEKKLIEEFGFKNKVKYIMGEVSPKKMANLINACDIYAAPARLEGFGMIHLEAQACGKPAVSINVGGPRDIIAHEKTGYLVDVAYEIKLDKEWVYPNMGFSKKMQIEFPIPKTFAYRADTQQLADYTLSLLKDANLRKCLGDAAAKHAMENFHYKVIAKKLIENLEKYYPKQKLKL